MDDLLLVLSVVTSLVFVIAPIGLAAAIIQRYRRVEQIVSAYTVTLRAVVGYIERGQRLEPNAADLTPLPPAGPAWLERIRHWLWPRAAPALPDYRAVDDFADYLTILREGQSEGERYIRFKRKSLKMRQDVDREVEYCRTYTESLPYLGILGTVLGFFFSPAVFGGSVEPGGTPASTIGGLVLALTSTATALICILLIKLGFENSIMSQVLAFEQALQALDDYTSRYGDIAQRREVQPA
jgi:hypothetical protein